MFEPSCIGIFINPFFIARRGLLTHIKQLSSRVTGKTLDVGCGTKPYKKYFASTEYIGLEIETKTNASEKKADVYYDGETFPFDNKHFDSVLTNQVLEHVFNPVKFLSEINRVLKMNGVLLLTVPFLWDEHEQPYDYARYSSFGVSHLLSQHGFVVLEGRKSVNNVSMFAQLINAYLYKLVQKNKLLKQVVTLFIFSFITILGVVLGVIFPKSSDLYLDNVILAKKVKDV